MKKLLEDSVRKLFNEIILEHHNLDKLFKTSLVSITDKRLEKTQRDAYFKQEYENGFNIIKSVALTFGAIGFIVIELIFVMIT